MPAAVFFWVWGPKCFSDLWDFLVFRGPNCFVLLDFRLFCGCCFVFLQNERIGAGRRREEQAELAELMRKNKADKALLGKQALLA